MNRASRFRPFLEAMEDRSLLDATVTYMPNVYGGVAGDLQINAGQTRESDTIMIFNDGNGNISGVATGFGQFSFANVARVVIDGAANGFGTNVSYYQTGDQVFAPNLAGLGRGVIFTVDFATGNNTFSADLSGHTLRQGTMSFGVFGGLGTDTVSFKAANFNIAALATLSVLAEGGGMGATGFDFSMNYSGVKTGALKVRAQAGDAQQDNLSLTVSLLGQSHLAYVIPFGRGDYPVNPGDLTIDGGPGDNEMGMFLYGPVPMTGDVYAGAPFFEPVEHNHGFRTRNVTAHNFVDFVINPVGGTGAAARYFRPQSF